MNRPKYFLDTKFIDNGKTIDLISIALICEDGRSLYKQNSECDFLKASDWVWRNVFPHLIHFDMRGARKCSSYSESVDSGLSKRTTTPCRAAPEDPCFWATRREIKDSVLQFCDPVKYGRPEFWGYFCDYDWVVFCQLFGSMIHLPKEFPMYCRDVKQWADQIGDIRIPKCDEDIHHALYDAEWVKYAFDYLTSLQPQTANHIK